MAPVDGRPERLWNDEGPACPFCGHVETPDEGYYFDEATTNLSCGDCGKDYGVEIFHSTSWTTRRLERAVRPNDDGTPA